STSPCPRPPLAVAPPSPPRRGLSWSRGGRTRRAPLRLDRTTGRVETGRRRPRVRWRPRSPSRPTSRTSPPRGRWRGTVCRTRLCACCCCCRRRRRRQARRRPLSAWPRLLTKR
ncbi:unnamed protein product, partial [Ectocarpus sp. 8 AP-2014]